MSEPATSPPACPHDAIFIEASGATYRTDDGRPVGMTVEVRATCRRCGSPFLFSDLVPLGDFGPDTPALSLDGRTLSVPIRPVSDMPAEQVARHGTKGEA
jgi:hypothetical protein